jgi:hypothetical protein
MKTLGKMMMGKMMGKERMGVATKKFSFLGFNPGPIFSYHFADNHFAQALVFHRRRVA